MCLKETVSSEKYILQPRAHNWHNWHSILAMSVDTLTLTRAPLGGQILPPPLSNIRDNLRTT